MQNKKVKHQPSAKYLYFHKITDPTLFFSMRKNRKMKKSFSYLLTKFFYSMLAETQLQFNLYGSNTDGSFTMDDSNSFFQSQQNSSNSSRRQILRDFFLFYHGIVPCVYS